MIAEHQVRQKLAKYLHEEISLDQFEDWLAQRSWNMHRDSEEAAQKLVSAIELRLAEHSSGHLDSRELHDELLPFVTSYTATVNFGSTDAPEPALFDSQNKNVKPRALVVRQGESSGYLGGVDILPVGAPA
jgi:hypothetical protein